MIHKVGVFVDSLASDSINRKLARALAKLSAPELELVGIPIRDVPLYSRDYDADHPPEGLAFKDAAATMDALFFVTPVYNRSILSFVNSPEKAQPEAYVRIAEGMIDDDGNVAVPTTEEFLCMWLVGARTA